jgi:hypothetical protein
MGLRKQIEKKANEKTIEQLYHDVFELLKNIFRKEKTSFAYVIPTYNENIIITSILVLSFMIIINDYSNKVDTLIVMSSDISY